MLTSANERSSISSSHTPTSTAIRRLCARSGRQWGSLRHRPCTRTWPIWSGRATLGATRPSHAPWRSSDASARPRCGSRPGPDRGAGGSAATARRRDRGRRSAPRRGEHRGLPRRPRAPRGRRRRLPPPRQGRDHDRGGHPPRRLRRRHASRRPGRGYRRRSRRGKTKPPTRRPSSGSSARTDAFASSPRTRRSSPSIQITFESSARSRESSGASSERGRRPQQHARPGAPRAHAWGEPRVPAVRGVRHARFRRVRVPGVRGRFETTAESRLQLGLQAG